MSFDENSERVFPLAGGSKERPRLRAPRLTGAMPVTPGIVMGNRAFLRAWAARRYRAGSPDPAGTSRADSAGSGDSALQLRR